MAGDGAGTCVVAGKGQRQVAVVVREQRAQVLRSRHDVLSRIECVGNAEFGRKRRHQLHQTLRTGARHRGGVEGRFRSNHRTDEFCIELVLVGGFLDQIVVRVLRRQSEGDGGPDSRNQRPGDVHVRVWRRATGWMCDVVTCMRDE